MSETDARTSVLIVDDQPDLRLILRRFLERSDRFDIVGEAEDGYDGIALAEDLQPDIVLLDVRMPNLDGREALPHILTKAPRSMVVMVSMLPAANEEDALIATGAFAYLEKQDCGVGLPDTLLSLLRSFRRALSGESVVAPSSLRRE